MSRVTKISLAEILDQIQPIVRKDEIIFFFNDRQVALNYIKDDNVDFNSIQNIRVFLLENEKYIDKEKLLLLLILNYKENIRKIINKMEELKQTYQREKTEITRIELSNFKKQSETQSKMLMNAINLGRGIKSLLTFYYYDEVEGRYKVEVTDANELIHGKKSNNIKALKRFDEIDYDFRDPDENDGLGLEYVMQAIALIDIYQIFPNESFGKDIITMIVDNEILKQENKTQKELKELKLNSKEYAKVVDGLDFKKLLPGIKAILREYVQYIDIDKLLLISAYRFYHELEHGKLAPESYSNVREILQGILENIDEKNGNMSCKLQQEVDDKYEWEDVSYSIKDIETTLSRFVGNTYITSTDIEEYKEKINDSEVTLLELPEGYGDVIFPLNEIENLAILSEDNLIYVSQKLNWEGKKIANTIKIMGTCRPGVLRTFIEEKKMSAEELIELYECGIISAEYVKGFESIIDLSGSINFGILNKYYNSLKQNPKDEECQDRYNKYINLYKTVLLTDKSKEEIQEESDYAIQEIIENYEGKEYNKAIKEYYKNGIITLDSVAEWSNEEVITQLHTEGLINLEDIEGLVRKEKISTRYITKIYEEAIWDSNLSEERRVSILVTGLVSMQTIETLYRKTLISNEDLRILSDRRVINENDRKRIIESLGMEEAEANSSICLTIDGNIQKIQGKEREDGETSYNYAISQRKEKIIISPNARDELFRLLGAKRVKTSKIDEDSPFYNYEFYAILGEDGKLHLDSPIIAERYFEDKETQRKFATENATYFFQYRDLMVLSNYTQKDEVVSKKENAVFRSNHTIANETRKGNWASSVIGNVVRTMLSSDLKEYNGDNQKLIILAKIREMYSVERIKEILELENQIDSGKHLYGVVKENKAPNLDDSDDGIR